MRYKSIIMKNSIQLKHATLAAAIAYTIFIVLAFMPSITFKVAYSWIAIRYLQAFSWIAVFIFFLTLRTSLKPGSNIHRVSLLPIISFGINVLNSLYSVFYVYKTHNSQVAYPPDSPWDNFVMQEDSILGIFKILYVIGAILLLLFFFTLWKAQAKGFLKMVTASVVVCIIFCLFALLLNFVFSGYLGYLWYIINVIFHILYPSSFALFFFTLFKKQN